MSSNAESKMKLNKIIFQCKKTGQKNTMKHKNKIERTIRKNNIFQQEQ